MKRISGGLPTTIISGALVVSGVLFATSGSGAATTPISQSTGRFLTGTIAGMSLDTIASINGEAAQNDGSTAEVVHANSLEAGVLNNAIKIPLQNGLQLPGLNVLQLGAVAQYAKAVSDGSALGAAGAVNDQGGVGLGGTSTTPADAKVDLSGLGGQSVASTLGNLKLNIGAISSQAVQLAGVSGAQSGTYKIAGMGLTLTAPLLAQTVGTITNSVNTAVSSVTGALAGLPGLGSLTNCPTPVGTATCIGGLSDISSLTSSLTSLSLAGGAVTASLTDGSITVDLDKLLKNATGLGLNEQPPNTHLVQYLVTALGTDLPAALTNTINDLSTQLQAKFNALKIYLAGVPIDSTLLATVQSTLLSTIVTPLTTALSGVTSQLAGAFTPLGNLLNGLLDIIVNGQDTTNGKFTETALLLLIGNAAGISGGVLPTGLPTSFAALPVPGSAHETPLAGSVRALGAPAVAAPAAVARPAAAPAAVFAPAAAVDASNALVSLGLAVSSVGPSSAVSTPTQSAIPTPSLATPGPTSSIHIQSGGGLSTSALKPVVTKGENRAPLGVALAVMGGLGLLVPRRRRLVSLVARNR